MKKYVRVKEGEIRENKWDGVIDCGYFFPSKTTMPLTLYKFLKEADNIEDLCDKFILSGRELDKPAIEEDLDFLRKAKKLGYEIYGAIWVIGKSGEPTLKPVAKMNEKGEFELL